MDRKIIVVATRERDNDLSTLESVVIPSHQNKMISI